MKLCIPVKLPEGLESHLEPHLPHAAYLVFFDTESRSIDSVSLREPQPGDERHMNFDAVLCGSISRVVLRTLAMQGVKVYGTAAQTAEQAIAQFENGELVAAETEAGGECGGGGCGGGGCGGGGCQSEHGHDDEHHHEHDHGHAGHGCGGGGCGGGALAHESHDHGHGGCCGGHGKAAEPMASRPLGETFTIAVCSQNRKTVTEHAGKCRKFWVYQIEQGEVTSKTLLELPLEQAFHSAAPDEPHPLDQVDVVIGATMGDGLKQRLSARRITGIVTDIETPDEAVAAFVARVLGTHQPANV